MGKMNAIVKLVKKVKKLEGILKRRNVVLSDSEEEEPEAQGRKSQDDPLVSLVQGLQTLSRVASLKPKSIDKGRRYKRRKETKGKKVVTSLDFQEEVDTGAKGVNTAEGVSTVSEQVSTCSTKRSIPSPDKGQREGKAPMIIEEAPKKSKEQILQEEASLAEAIRLDTLQKEEVAKQVHLDSLLAQRIAEEEELNEQQKKRRAQVQFEAQHYTDEDWDLRRSKELKANAELSKTEDIYDELFEESGDMEVISAKEFDKEDDQPRKSGKRRKHMARKGLHTDIDKDDSEDSDEVSEQDDSVSAMLDKKLQGGKPDENCYKMLKMMEKQAGAKGLTSPEQTAIGKGISNPFMAVMVYQKPYGIQLIGVNTPGSDENILKL
ncbi:hypothetical protein Tco_0537034 [Tanacetum coccineum]